MEEVYFFPQCMFVINYCSFNHVRHQFFFKESLVPLHNFGVFRFRRNSIEEPIFNVSFCDEIPGGIQELDWIINNLIVLYNCVNGFVFRNCPGIFSRMLLRPNSSLNTFLRINSWMIENLKARNHSPFWNIYIYKFLDNQ